jgi:hypothetical protein
MKALGHYRLASAAAGDDGTLTRYVRTNRDADHKPRKHQPRIPGLAPAFVEEGRTKFTKAVQPVATMKALLVSGHSNVKIGRDVRKGRFRGYWIYTLSLEERKTCPSSCHHWSDCYGNNMPFAKRIDHTDPEFLPRLEAEIARLVSVRGRAGVLVRLHALGDFYHPAYVDFWRDQLRKHPRLAIYGYTAHPWASTIGQRLQLANDEFGERAMVRNSDGRRKRMATVSVTSRDARPDNAFVCPEQTGQTKCCATCGACWSTPKNVAFLAH